MLRNQHPIIAIGLESADSELIEKWMSEGHLPNFSRLCQQGAYGHITNVEYHATETEWTTFLTGCLPQKNNYWRPLKFCPQTYSLKRIGAYKFVEFKPFYSLAIDRKVAVFDMPQSTISAPVNGIHVLGWGGHRSETRPCSKPDQLITELSKKYGKHPALNRAFGDNWWDRDYLKFLQKSLKVGISRRAAISKDLLRREKWDLFLTVFGETHGAGHNFWHLSQPSHPLYQEEKKHNNLGDPLLAVFQYIDQALGEILAEIDDNAYVIVFDLLGMSHNSNEVPSMLFLPEFLYRFNFPGKCGIAPGNINKSPKPPITNPNRKTWAAEVWQLKFGHNPITKLLRQRTSDLGLKLMAKGIQKLGLSYISGQPDIVSPYQLGAEIEPFWWQPTMWYKRCWDKMKAFALPSFSDGFIRINLEGREARGIVPSGDYNLLCETLTQELYQLRDPRTGKAIAKKVIRTRQVGEETDVNLPDADLVVVWDEIPTDVVDNPNYGRIGPVPYHRSGGHRDGGFLIAKGPGIPSNSTLPQGHAIDLAPTILDLLGVPIPGYFDGKALLTDLLKAKL